MAGATYFLPNCDVQVKRVIEKKKNVRQGLDSVHRLLIGCRQI